MCSATTMTECTVMRIAKKSMMDVIHKEREFSDMFVAYLLMRNIRYEEDLVAQLFNSSEKRLARILLLLANFGKDGKPEVAIPKISQDSLTPCDIEWWRFGAVVEKEFSESLFEKISLLLILPNLVEVLYTSGT
jgi:hypothetical protein